MVGPFRWSRGGFALPGKDNPDRGLAHTANVGFAARTDDNLWRDLQMSDARDSITLRRACEADIPTFVRLQSDAEAAYSAAFGAVRSAEDNAAHWADLLRNAETEVLTILAA